MVSIAIPLGIGGTILAKPIMNLLYGAKYEGGVIALQILIWSVALICINSTYAWGLYATDRQNRFLKVVTLQATVNLILNFILISPFGLIGASVATLVAEIIGLPLYYAEFSKVTFVPFKCYILKPLFASIAMGVFVYCTSIVSLNIFALITGSVIVYFVVLYAIGGILKEDMELIKNMFPINKQEVIKKTC